MVGEGWVEEFSSENLGFILSFIAHYLGHLNLSSPPQSSLIYVTHDGGNSFLESVHESMKILHNL